MTDDAGDDGVTFVVVAYNSNADLPRLFTSLADQSDGRFECVVVDNSDAERARDVVSNACVPVTLLEPSGNIGYLGGARYAVHRTQGGSPQWWVVCNADVAFDRDFVRSLLEPHEPDVLCLAPRIETGDGTGSLNPFMVSRPPLVRSLVRYLQFITPWVGQRTIDLSLRLNRGRSQAPAQRERRIIYAPHGSVLCLRSTLLAGDRLADAPFLFGEEVFIAEAVASAGGIALYDPAVRCTHFEHSSTGVKRSPVILRCQRAGALDTLRRHVASRLDGAERTGGGQGPSGSGTARLTPVTDDEPSGR
jgi:GT2 family glycosyltransferase